MRVAILFTGQYRCFDKTYQNIQQNILIPNDAKAFVYCETSASREDFTHTPHDELVKKSLFIFEIFIFLELFKVASILF